MIIGYFLGGWLIEAYGWRITFALLGTPGLALAGVAFLTLREPRRDRTRRAEQAATRESSFVQHPRFDRPLRFLDVIRTLWINRSFCHLLLCLAISSFFGYGLLQWEPAYFIRSYGVTTREVGNWFALIYGVGGFIGTYLGGELASRYAAQKEATQLKGMAVGYCCFGVFSAGIYLSPNRVSALLCLALATLGGFTVNGPLFAAIQTVVPERMRAQAIALVYLFSNLIGLGLGPLAAGMLSDSFKPWAGEDSLRYSLLVLSPGYLWVGWHAWRAAKTVTQDVERSKSEAMAGVPG
jgi:MFS family permease